MKGNKLFSKAVSLAMILSLLLPIASCGKQNNDDERRVSKNIPWFTSATYDIDIGADSERELENTYNLFFSGADEKYLVVSAQGQYKGGEMNPSTDWSKYKFYNITVLDRKSKEVVNRIDVQSAMKNGDDERVDTIYYLNGKITVRTNLRELDYDPLTSNVVDTRKTTETDMGIDSSYVVGDYLVEADTIWKTPMYCLLHIKAPDGTKTTVELKEPDTDIFVYGVFALSDTKALILADIRTDKKIYELDLINNTITAAEDTEYDWIDIDELTGSTVGSDGMLYFETSGGVFRINANTKSTEKVLDFNYCAANRGTLNLLNLAECSGDSVFYIGQAGVIDGYSDPQRDFQLVELTKTDKNPNVGKKILELYSPYIDENVGSAILTYNDSNDKYFIEVVDRYNETKYRSSVTTKDIQSMTEEELNLILLSNNSGLTNDLISDIVAGKGPDILLNTSRYSQLNNPDYLVDLTPYVNDLDPELYFTNIVDRSKTNGALYQLPVSFGIKGIYTDAGLAGSSGTGFTFDEYESFLHDTLNGTDIIWLGQTLYFSSLFNSMSDKFIVNGKADFTGPEFAEMAEYVKNNIPETFDFSKVQSDRYADYGEIQGIGEFYSKGKSVIGIEDPVVLGIPSFDGRGPMFVSRSSVAISAQSTDVNACGDFIKLLLSEDIQTGMAMNDCFVLNRKAFRRAGEAANEYYNNGGNHSGSTHALLGDGEKLTDEDLNAIENVISSCSGMYTENTAISIILIEEMPAYFLDQKDLDAVILIIQDRAQKVLDERG